jgi:DNA-binding NarL/FixJ family response regulator
MPPKIATRSSVERIAYLDRMLRLGATMGSMTARLGCCEKTVRRHLSWMSRKLRVRIDRIETADQTVWRYRHDSPRIFTAEATRELQ